MQTTVFQRLVTWLIGTDLSGCGKIRSLTQKLVQVLLQTSRPPGTPPLSFCSQHKQTKKHDNILFPNLFLTKHLAFILEAPHFSLFPPNKFSLMENDQHKYSRVKFLKRLVAKRRPLGWKAQCMKLNFITSECCYEFLLILH